MSSHDVMSRGLQDALQYEYFATVRDPEESTL